MSAQGGTEAEPVAAGGPDAQADPGAPAGEGAPAPAGQRPPVPMESEPARGQTLQSRPGGGRRLRRWLWPASVTAGLLLVSALTILSSRPTSTIALAPDNPRPSGARAVAEILRDQGVQIAFRRTVGGAVAAVRDGGTLFVTDPALLSSAQWQAVAATGADLALTNVAYADLDQLPGDVETTALGGDGIRDARCSDPDALAAGTLSTGSGDVRALGSAATVCFPYAVGPDVPDLEPGVGAYAVIPDGDRTITILANSYPITNAGLDEAGNAALVLRMLGRSEHLTWFVPSPTDTDAGASGSVLPPVAGVVGAWALVLVAAASLWRGRRLGRVVVEPLPVLVPPAETTLGRARLYRRARAHGHAAAALRAGAASRLAHRLGVPESAGPRALVEALARATERPPADVRHLLYGPPPDDDATLLDLVRALDALESEVRP